MRRWTRCTALLALALPLLSAQNGLAQQPQPPAQPQPAQPQQPPADDAAPKAPENADSEDPGDAEGADEGDEPDPARPAPKDKGAVWGIITDSGTKEPIIDATVTGVGTKFKAVADLDGRFRLELPPGTYELRVWYELYKARRVRNLRVTAGKLERLDILLEVDQAQTVEEEVEIELDPVRASVVSQLAIRKNAPTVGDAVSAQEIAKTPDRNAADAARRVVGASVVGGKYVYVRGLGERYTNSLLNGVPLPSPEPDKQAVPLDLFPSVILSDLTITKTFSPDMPGDFAGGSVRINTRDLPEKFLFQGTLSVGFNTANTFRDRLSYRGSNTDWLGIDDGTRAIPEGTPTYPLVRFGDKPDGTKVTPDELTFWGRQVNAYMSTQKTINPPNMSGNVVVGDTLKFGVNQRLGYTVALTYGRRFMTRTDETVNNFIPSTTEPGALDSKNIFVSERGNDAVSWGGFAALAYRPIRGQKITLTGLHSRSSDNEARFIEGSYEEKPTRRAQATRLRFMSRSMTFGQLAGEHKLPSWNKPTVDWNLSLSLATADEPDTRDTAYFADCKPEYVDAGKRCPKRNEALPDYYFESSTQSGSHF